MAEEKTTVLATGAAPAPEVKLSDYKVNLKKGLTLEEVEQRRQEGKNNVDDSGQTKTIKQIVLGHVCTLFNFINLILAVAVIAVGSFKNVAFMGIIIANTAIGIFQEIRSKRTMDRLTFLSASKVKVVRDGKEEDVHSEDVVQDDLMILEAGNQVQADALVLDGTCQVDESFITGEADAIIKEPGDTMMAGSFLISGKCRAQAVQVGKNKYVSSISSGAKVVKKINSEIMTSLQWIVRVISVLIVPLGIIIFLKQFNLPDATFQSAVVSTTASLIGMIPEGLMLLTSTALAVSVIRLSQYKVMVQQLYCIETLARVDTLCLDKTGTLTEGYMEVVDTMMLGEAYAKWIPKALIELTKAIPDHNATFKAIMEKYPDDGSEKWKCKKAVSFSSKTKWSGAYFEEHGTFCIGAAEFLYPSMGADLRKKIEEYAMEYRVLLVVHSDEKFKGENLPDASAIVPIGLILLRDKVREAAKPTLEYFAQQGVDIKVISGDSPQTVAGIAKYAGVKNWDKMVDASTLQTDEDFAAAATKYTVFGRVTPQQKKQLVQAMKKAGRTVAMTGDGVNDVLALKEADCSIAMASGTDAARNAAELVLLESNFDAMPHVVAEGRRCINNVQRSASLFLIKTVYSGLLALLFAFITLQYPFIPIQMSLISTSCIGIPAFFLALQPNRDRVKGKFLRNVLSKAIPGGLSVVINICFILFCAGRFGLESSMVSTLCVVVAGFTGLLILYRISKPFNWLRVTIYVCVTIIFWGGILFFPGFFALQRFNADLIVFMMLFMSAAYGLFSFMFQVFDDRTEQFAKMRARQAERKAERQANKELEAKYREDQKQARAALRAAKKEARYNKEQ
ncbi:MAG: HAD-IC family P-type ATPase [Firmicutes bacterium]|nr:HAD-IC family P-type ATPase [Bacillota bacterium]